MIDANLTLNQLANANNGANRLKAMIGAKNFMKDDENNAVSFKFMKGANKANYVKIKLNAMDTYDVEFGRIHGMNYKVMSSHEGIYNDMLFGLFEDETKLRLKLF